MQYLNFKALQKPLETFLQRVLFSTPKRVDMICLRLFY